MSYMQMNAVMLNCHTQDFEVHKIFCPLTKQGQAARRYAWNHKLNLVFVGWADPASNFEVLNQDYQLSNKEVQAYYDMWEERNYWRDVAHYSLSALFLHFCRSSYRHIKKVLV